MKNVFSSLVLISLFFHFFFTSVSGVGSLADTAAASEYQQYAYFQGKLVNVFELESRSADGYGKEEKHLFIQILNSDDNLIHHFISLLPHGTSSTPSPPTGTHNLFGQVAQSIHNNTINFAEQGKQKTKQEGEWKNKTFDSPHHTQGINATKNIVEKCTNNEENTHPTDFNNTHNNTKKIAYSNDEREIRNLYKWVNGRGTVQLVEITVSNEDLYNEENEEKTKKEIKRTSLKTKEEGNNSVYESNENSENQENDSSANLEEEENNNWNKKFDYDGDDEGETQNEQNEEQDEETDDTDEEEEGEEDEEDEDYDHFSGELSFLNVNKHKENTDKDEHDEEQEIEGEGGEIIIEEEDENEKRKEKEKKVKRKSKRKAAQLSSPNLSSSFSGSQQQSSIILKNQKKMMDRNESRYELYFHFFLGKEKRKETIGPFYMYKMLPVVITCVKNDYDFKYNPLQDGLKGQTKEELNKKGGEGSDTRTSQFASNVFDYNNDELGQIRDTKRVFSVHRHSQQLNESSLNDLFLVLQDVAQKRTKQSTFFSSSLPTPLDTQRCTASVNYEYTRFFEGWAKLKRNVNLFYIKSEKYIVKRNVLEQNKIMKKNNEDTNEENSEIKLVEKKIWEEKVYYFVTPKTRQTKSLKKIKDVIEKTDLSRFGIDKDFVEKAYNISNICGGLFTVAGDTIDLACQTAHYSRDFTFPDYPPPDRTTYAPFYLYGPFKKIVQEKPGRFYWNMILQYSQILDEFSKKDKYVNHARVLNELLLRNNDTIPLITAVFITQNVCVAVEDAVTEESLWTMGDLYPMALPFALPSIRSISENQNFAIPRETPFHAKDIKVTHEEFGRKAAEAVKQLDEKINAEGENVGYNIHKTSTRFKQSFNKKSAGDRDQKKRAEPWREVLYETWHNGYVLTQQITRLSMFFNLWKNFTVDEFWKRPWIVKAVWTALFVENKPVANSAERGICGSRKTEPFLIELPLAVFLKRDREFPMHTDDLFDYLKIKPEYIFVFRGTGTPKSWVVNFMYDSTEDDILNTGGRIHEGFRELFLRMYKSKLDKYIKKLRKRLMANTLSYSILFVGYSLGGAMAIISGFYIVKQLLAEFPYLDIVALTYGAPAIGDDILNEAIFSSGMRIQQVAMNTDPIPLINGDPRLYGLSSNSPHIYINAADIASYNTKGFDGRVWLDPPTLNKGFRDTIKNLAKRRVFSFYCPQFRRFNADLYLTHCYAYSCHLALLAGRVDHEGKPNWSSFCSALLMTETYDGFFHKPAFYDHLLVVHQKVLPAALAKLPPRSLAGQKY